MTLSSEDMDLIERSLSGELSADDQRLLDDRKESDEEFAEAWRNQRQILSTFKADQQVALKNELKELFRETLPQQAGESNGSPWRRFLVAASFLAFVAIWGALWWTQAPPLFDQYFQTFPAKQAIRSETDLDAAAQVMRWYSSGEYERMIDAIENQQLTSAPIEGQSIYLGNAYLAQGESHKAIEVLASVSPDDSYYQDALWYLALAHLSLGEEEKTLETLALMDERHPLYRKSIISLREDLR